MNTQPISETDAAWACFKGYMEPLQDVKDLSRKLERERDEARDELKKLEGAYEDATNYYARMIELKEERDETLKNLEEEMKFHHRTHSELVKANCKILDLQMQLDHLTPQTQTKKNQ